MMVVGTAVGQARLITALVIKEEVMNPAEVMHQYNEYERKKINAFNGTTVSTPEIVKFVSQDPHGSYISYFNLTEDNAKREIEKQVRYFKELGLNFEWKTYDTDLPVNMGQLLLENGFMQADTESFMVLDLTSTQAVSVNESAFVEVSDAEGIRDAIKVQEQVWAGDFEWHYNYLLNLKTQSPDSVSIYVVYADGQPVTSAWLTFNGDSPFAGIWGGSTIETYRCNGYYSLLLNKRIAEAKSRGKKYLIIDASDMSRSIVEKYGFKFVATTVGYNYENC